MMREISGGDALEVGTVWQEKQSVRERGTKTGSGVMKQLKVTDVSCLAISDMIHSLPVFQMHRP